MQIKNPLIDNLSKVMADAFGAAHSAKNEAENVFKTWLDGWLADRDFVTREEFEALKLSVEELRNKSREKGIPIRSPWRNKSTNDLNKNYVKSYVLHDRKSFFEFYFCEFLKIEKSEFWNF